MAARFSGNESENTALYAENNPPKVLVRHSGEMSRKIPYFSEISGRASTDLAYAKD